MMDATLINSRHADAYGAATANAALWLRRARHLAGLCDALQRRQNQAVVTIAAHEVEAARLRREVAEADAYCDEATGRAKYANDSEVLAMDKVRRQRVLIAELEAYLEESQRLAEVEACREARGQLTEAREELDVVVGILQDVRVGREAALLELTRRDLRSCDRCRWGSAFPRADEWRDCYAADGVHTLVGDDLPGSMRVLGHESATLAVRADHCCEMWESEDCAGTKPEGG